MRRSKLWSVSFSVLIVVAGFLPGLAKEVREECLICGMWIDQHMSTRHVISTADGSKVSFCSFTCAARFLKLPEVKARRLQVGDYQTVELVDVKKAFYLVGSDAPPVMSQISIIAFYSREAAENFGKLHGGIIMNFDEMMVYELQPEGLAMVGQLTYDLEAVAETAKLFGPKVPGETTGQ
jgi:nitrous oxide reductase accessory protein NosL